MAANISTETYSILHDSRGEDVRDSLCEACEKIAVELLPDVTAEDAGKVLGVNQYGEWVAARYVPYWRLQYITVTTQPTKTSYFVGEQLDLTGVVITAHYGSDFEPDKTEVVTQDCIFSPVDGTVLTYDTQSVSVEFSDGGVTATTSIHLDVSLVLPVSLAVTTMPTKTQYDSGDELDLTGIVVTATYNNGTTAVVTSSCTFNPDDGDTLTGSNKSVTVSYESLGQIVTTSFAISVTPAVDYISVITRPAKTSYVLGDNLDLSGIVVKAHYEGGTVMDVTSDCVFSPADGTVLDTLGDQTVSVSYTDNGKTVATSFGIKVAVVVLTEINLTKVPKLEYIQGESLDLTGIVVTATYSNGNTANVTHECVFYPSHGTVMSDLGTQSVDISYTEDGVTKTTAFYVTVSDFEIERIEIAAIGHDFYVKGDAFDASSIRVVAYYTDGTFDNIVSGYTITPENGSILQEVGNLEVSVTYTDPVTGKTFTDKNYQVDVGILAQISIFSRPTKSVYQQGEALDLTGTRVSTVYEYNDDGSRIVGNIDITDCVTNPSDGTILNTIGTNTIVISYTRNEVTKTTNLYVTVQ